MFLVEILHLDREWIGELAIVKRRVGEVRQEPEVIGGHKRGRC